jgi:hypothetical protein
VIATQAELKQWHERAERQYPKRAAAIDKMRLFDSLENVGSHIFGLFS